MNDFESVNTYDSLTPFQRQMTPQMIRDRIRKRKPNPAKHLTTRQATYQRFGNRCMRGARTYSPWHNVDMESNKSGKRNLVILDDGSEYIGEWQDNLRNGNGNHYTAKGYYSGEFLDDKYDGQGDYYIWCDETNCDQPGLWLLYAGNWKDGKYDGHGVLYARDYSTYDGQFSNGKKCGQGTMLYANEDTYVGEWDNDMKNGDGEFTKTDGDVFTGCFKDDKKHGNGVLHRAKSKKRIEGYWVEDNLKCGSIFDEPESPHYVQPDDISGTTDGMIPVIETQDADQVLNDQIDQIEGQANNC